MDQIDSLDAGIKQRDEFKQTIQFCSVIVEESKFLNLVELRGIIQMGSAKQSNFCFSIENVQNKLSNRKKAKKGLRDV